MPVAKRKRVSHEERLTVVQHLDELRSRLIVSGVVVALALALCFWQNGLVLGLLNRPLDGRQPATFGVAEQFTTTLSTALYAALLLSMPILLYQAYAFVLPAFTQTERRVALPLLLMVPFLFAGGVAFGFLIILPNAIDFLLGFNADEFNTLLRARDYYSFVALTLIAMGLLFQIPVGVLAAVKLGITTPKKLRQHRRYAILAIAVVAMLLPGQDPVTMLIAMLPLTLLYELSILLAAAFGRPSEDVAERLAAAEGS